MSEERRSVAPTFSCDPIWTEQGVGYLSKRAVPDWRDAARILADSIGTDAADVADDGQGLDDCHLRFVTDEDERLRLAWDAGIELDPDENYFQECGADEGEPFWRVES